MTHLETSCEALEHQSSRALDDRAQAAGAGLSRERLSRSPRARPREDELDLVVAEESWYCLTSAFFGSSDLDQVFALELVHAEMTAGATMNREEAELSRSSGITLTRSELSLSFLGTNLGAEADSVLCRCGDR